MSPDLTQTLLETSAENPEQAVQKLLPLVYDDLRDIAANYLRGERKNHTLQPTALVHEAFLKLVDQSRVDWKGRTHFLAVGAAAMRRILIDHARAHNRDKRGGGRHRVAMTDEFAVTDTGDVDSEALHDALELLATLDPVQARVVELRFFGGLTVDEVAHVLDVSKRTVEGHWTHAKAWLKTRLAANAGP
jgi:RNA polymerase sigma factor (TIGR02999 family)